MAACRGDPPLRVCMVTDNYYPYVGGIPDHIHYLAVELRRRGHTVKVLTSTFGGKTIETLDRTPGEEHVFRVGRALLVPTNRSFARIPTAWRPTHQVRQYFERGRFDIVHIHGTLAPSLPIVSLRASNAVNVFTFHADFRRSFAYTVLKPLLNPYFKMIHGLIAVSERARDSTARYFAGPYRIIPNAIDIQAFRPDVEPMPGLDDGRPRILFLGRFEPRKGLKYLLMALPEIVRHVPDVQLVAVGAGPFGYSYRDFLDKRLADHVVWPGLIPGEDRPRYYRSCDVYCSPATGNESFGIVLLEAMATGRPVVASDIEGYRKVVGTDGREGLLVPPCDPGALAEALVGLLKDPARRRRMGEAGRQKALGYSWPRIADRIEACYRELLDRYPAPRYGR
ncbi:MAG: glycosyltransferase family 4 protein [bacterium]